MEIKKEIREKISRTLKVNVRGINAPAGKNVYLNRSELPESGVLKVGPKQDIVLPRKSAVAFADLAPNYNWGHPCKHMLFDAETGEMYDSVDAQFPPGEYYTNRENFDTIQEQVKQTSIINDRKLRAASIPGLTNALTNSRGNRYAILFSGMSDNRHTNDLEFIYRVLIDVYGFNAANIQVLNENGTLHYAGAPTPIGNWPGNNTAYRMPVNARGGNTELRDAIRNLRTQLEEGDFLFIHTNNHGGHDGTQSNLCCWPNWASWDASDYGTELAALPVFDSLMVMMEQCHSGGFMTPTINNSTAKWTHFSAACREDKNSIGGANFDPFAYDWIASVNGQYADGSALASVADTNIDGRISATEAHNYANVNKDPYDTPVTDESPSSVGDYIFLGYPDHDLFIRDNLKDYGREPLIDGGICSSPDVIIYNQELLDPAAILETNAAQKRDDLGEQVESGQDNFIYLRVQNRGTSSTSGNARLYWSPPSTFPTPASWNFLGQVAIPSLSPNEFKALGPIKWKKNDIPATGHYCFIALIDSGSDPAPDPSTITNISDFRNFISNNNNATWKNFNVVDMFAGTTNSMKFHIQGWPRERIYTDLQIGIKELPNSAEVKLRILKRLTNGATAQDMTLIKETSQYREYSVKAGKTCLFKNLELQPSDNSIAKLEFILPDTITDGGYRIHVAQIIDGMEIGRVTSLLSIGKHAIVGNRSTKEIHLPTCEWVRKMNRSKNKTAFDKPERAIKNGYNGCKYCLPEYDTD